MPTLNCCAWPGVECDNAATTKHVVGLHLGYNDSSPYSMLSSEAIDSSLLELKYLSYLDLSGNSFWQSRIPSFLGSMKQLQYLNLSDAGSLLALFLTNLATSQACTHLISKEVMNMKII
ncbi:hypothetical protein CASFOL_002541 [Castilleja foliolosa]|uniref:Uncharacterized protein n=1 Tax=Castilleja foliolosa TaxID=1961234 RepID=A0ABD3EEL8_9LAMI